MAEEEAAIMEEFKQVAAQSASTAAQKAPAPAAGERAPAPPTAEKSKARPEMG
jgi:hypothetical protein